MANPAEATERKVHDRMGPQDTRHTFVLRPMKEDVTGAGSTWLAPGHAEMDQAKHRQRDEHAERKERASHFFRSADILVRRSFPPTKSLASMRRRSNHSNAQADRNVGAPAERA